METPELESCPFCGGDAQWDRFAVRDMGISKIYCVSCFATTMGDASASITAERWNTRAEMKAEKGATDGSL